MLLCRKILYFIYILSILFEFHFSMFHLDTSAVKEFKTKESDVATKIGSLVEKSHIEKIEITPELNRFTSNSYDNSDKMNEMSALLNKFSSGNLQGYVEINPNQFPLSTDLNGMICATTNNKDMKILFDSNTRKIYQEKNNILYSYENGKLFQIIPNDTDFLNILSLTSEDREIIEELHAGEVQKFRRFQTQTIIKDNVKELMKKVNLMEKECSNNLIIFDKANRNLLLHTPKSFQVYFLDKKIQVTKIFQSEFIKKEGKKINTIVPKYIIINSNDMTKIVVDNNQQFIYNPVKKFNKIDNPISIQTIYTKDTAINDLSKNSGNIVNSDDKSFDSLSNIEDKLNIQPGYKKNDNPDNNQLSAISENEKTLLIQSGYKKNDNPDNNQLSAISENEKTLLIQSGYKKNDNPDNNQLSAISENEKTLLIQSGYKKNDNPDNNQLSAISENEKTLLIQSGYKKNDNPDNNQLSAISENEKTLLIQSGYKKNKKNKIFGAITAVGLLGGLFLFGASTYINKSYLASIFNFSSNSSKAIIDFNSLNGKDLNISSDLNPIYISKYNNKNKPNPSTYYPESGDDTAIFNIKFSKPTTFISALDLSDIPIIKSNKKSNQLQYIIFGFIFSSVILIFIYLLYPRHLDNNHQMEYTAYKIID